MNRRIFVMLLILTIFLAGVPQAVANRNIFGQFKSEYNANGTKLDTCMTCMKTLPPEPVSWNTYGLDLRSGDGFDRNNSVPAMRNIESRDSDGDGFTNIDEIRKFAFPGNASDFPAIPPTVTQTQVATPTMTVPKSTDTIMNAFVTLAILLGISFFVIKKRKS